MYRLRHFKEIYGKCCCVGNVDSFTATSIYDFYPLSFENLLNNIIGLLTPCEAVYLRWLYWYVLLLCLLKIFNSIFEINAIFGPAKKLYVFRDRQLLNVSNRWRFKVRQFAVCLICIMDLHLALGVLMMKPHFMTPWICVQLFTLLFEISLYISDVCCGIETPSCRELVMFLLIYFNLESVWCIRKIFVRAISAVDNTDGYSLFGNQ